MAGHGRCRTREVVAALLRRVRGRFSAELELSLQSRRSRDLFLWFLASMFFGARISGSIATRTYTEFVRRELVTPAKLLATGWDGLVEVLDAGGYVRYDYKTATKLLEVVKNLLDRYGGDLNRLHAAARDADDLIDRLKGLGKGIGDVTVQIFLRELREVWPKADPPLSPLALLAADHVRLFGGTRRCRPSDRLEGLRDVWKEAGSPRGHFVDFESALVRLGRDYCRRQRRDTCPMRDFCRGATDGRKRGPMPGKGRREARTVEGDRYV